MGSEMCIRDSGRPTSIYLDDVLIFVKTREEHEKIKEVLQRIKANNLSLNLSKCKFYQEFITFCGHKIFDGKISSDPNRTSTILKFPTPENAKELQRFLGMTNFS